MKIMTLPLNNTFLGYYELQENTSDERHDHGAHYQFSIPVYGEPKIKYNGQTHLLDLTNISCCNPGDIHQNFAHNNRMRLMLITIKQSFVERLVSDTLGTQTTGIELAPFSNQQVLEIRRRSEAFMKKTIDQPLSQIEIDEFEHDLICLILKNQLGSHSIKWDTINIEIKHPSIKRIVDYLYEHSHLTLSLTDISTAVHISKPHLNRLFRHQFGMTISQFLNLLRLQKAEVLLRKSKKSITTISLQVGFGSLSTFERNFKHHYGITPNDFRKSTL